MVNAAKFIDFFVHDILDYTILNKDHNKFKPQNQLFDIRDAIIQIIEIQEDKARMKQINITTEYFGFEESSYNLFTD